MKLEKYLNDRISMILLFSGLIVFLLGIVLFFWKDSIFDFNEKIDSDKVGNLGSFIGGLVGSIWSLAGIVLFYLALSEQRKDLKINHQALEQQIEEFRLQKHELSQTREVFKIQSETLKLQQFAINFF